MPLFLCSQSKRLNESKPHLTTSVLQSNIQKYISLQEEAQFHIPVRFADVSARRVLVLVADALLQ
jgi:hypothetical protein